MQREQVIYLGGRTGVEKDSPHQYAQSCELYQILSEVSRIVARKNNINASLALTEYLNQCNKGEHVVLKSYSSFSKSIVNRQCFLYNFCKIFQTQTNVRNGLDYYQLFRLLCSDFPKDVIVNAVRIIEGEHQKMLETLVNSQKFLNALYITFIYSQYLDQLLQKIFKGKHAEEASIVSIFEWFISQDAKRVNYLEKPNLQILIQIILNIITNQSQNSKGGRIKFVNYNTVKDYILNTAGEAKVPITINYNKLLSKLLESKRHQKFVEKNIFIFDNSSNWATEATKIINVKQTQNPQPLNSKKMKKK